MRKWRMRSLLSSPGQRKHVDGSATHFLTRLLGAHPEVNLSIPLPLGGTAGRNLILKASHEGGAHTFAQRHLCLVILFSGDLSFGFNSHQGWLPALFRSNHSSLAWFPSLPTHPLPGTIILHQMVPAGARLALGGGTTPLPPHQPAASCFLWAHWQGFLDN